MGIISENKTIQNDMKYFQELITPFYDFLYKFIYCIVHNKMLAEDIFQTTLLKGYEHFGELNDSNNFKSWMFSIGRNEAISTLRKYRRDVSIDITEHEGIIDNDDFFPEEYLIRNELKVAVIDAINHLDDMDREIVILRYYTGLKFEEIAEVLNINYNTIRTRHRIIKNKIFKYLEQHGFVQ